MESLREEHVDEQDRPDRQRAFSVHHSQTSSDPGSARSSDDTTSCVLSTVRGRYWVVSWRSLFEKFKGHSLIVETKLGFVPCPLREGWHIARRPNGNKLRRG